jgi:hypothetical protein
MERVRERESMTAIIESRRNTVRGEFLSWRVESIDLRSFDLVALTPSEWLVTFPYFPAGKESSFVNKQLRFDP